MVMNLNAAKARELTNEALFKERQKYGPVAERYIADYIENEIREACEQGRKSCHITMPEDKTLCKYVRKCLEENGFSINSFSFWSASWKEKEE
jgi:hypothetical protein